MNIVLPKGFRSSIIVMVVGLATFLVVASLFLITNPISSSIAENHTKVIIINNHSVYSSISRNDVEVEKVDNNELELNSNKKNNESIFSGSVNASEKSNMEISDNENSGLDTKISSEEMVDENVIDSKNGSLEIRDGGNVGLVTKNGSEEMEVEENVDGSKNGSLEIRGDENVGSVTKNGSEEMEVDNNVNDSNNGSLEGRKDESAPLDDANVIPPESSSCDLYDGKWFYDPAGPLYTNSTCPLITQMQNCQGNGRPDKEYENYRWKPNQCDLTRFNPRKFLELMRDKTLAFIGDSVSRNQMESMLCILWQEETPKNRGYRRMQRWQFRSTNTIIIRIWSSWLTHTTDAPFQYAPRGITKVFLDIPDPNFMEFLPSFDVLVLSSGHWFAKQSAYVLNNNIVGTQLWQPKNPANLKIDNINAFGISVEKILTAVADHVNFTGLAIVRTYSPDHYEGGEWNTGGSCTGKVRPLDEVVRSGFTDAMHEQQVAGFKRALEKSENARNKLRLMDITEVFGYRADGHPGPFRNPDPNKITKRGPNGEPPPQDCLHWCMPGPVDIWNEMLMEVVRREYEKA